MVLASIMLAGACVLFIIACVLMGSALRDPEAEAKFYEDGTRENWWDAK